MPVSSQREREALVDTSDPYQYHFVHTAYPLYMRCWIINMIRQKEFRLAKRQFAGQTEYLTQWRYVYADTKKVSKWWQIWLQNYEMVYEYGEWVDMPAVDITSQSL